MSTTAKKRRKLPQEKMVEPLYLPAAEDIEDEGSGEDSEEDGEEDSGEDLEDSGEDWEDSGEEDADMENGDMENGDEESSDVEITSEEHACKSGGTHRQIPSRFYSKHQQSHQDPSPPRKYQCG